MQQSISYIDENCDSDWQIMVRLWQFNSDYDSVRVYTNGRSSKVKIFINIRWKSQSHRWLYVPIEIDVRPISFPF